MCRKLYTGGLECNNERLVYVLHGSSVVNALYQSVLDGAAITVDLIEQVIEEAKKDVSHPQLRPVVIRIRDHEQELVAA